VHVRVRVRVMHTRKGTVRTDFDHGDINILLEEV
jgi:hypothetical protein